MADSLHGGPAGPCEWCGGPQVWTIVRGEMYVSCDGGCQPLPLEGLVPTPGCEEVWAPVTDEERERFDTGGGKGTPEGTGARMSDHNEHDLGAPPPGFLDSLWEGGWDAKTT